MVSEPQIPSWLEPLYPFRPGRFRTARGASLSFVDEGPRSEEAVLMLHGNPTWSFYFRDLLRELSAERRCIAPDHIGMGLSEKPAGYDYTLASRIDDIEALVTSLRLKRVDLVLHDWGGAIGMGLAARRPEWIGRLVITNTAAFQSSRIPWRIRLCRAPILGALLVRGVNAFVRGALTMAMAARSLSRDERRAYLLPYGSWAQRAAVYAFVRDIPLETGHPSRPALAAIERALPGFAANPKLILWGGRDFCFDGWFYSRWRSLYPDAQSHFYPEAGHYLFEDAGEDTRRRIRTFLIPNSPDSR